jgi:hypothetical protein
MKLHSVIGTACTALSVICLGLAYMREGRWWILAVLAAMSIFWLAMKRWSLFGSASALLLIYLAAAATGVLTNLPVPLLVTGCTFALVSWDLALFSEKMETNPSSPLAALMERAHLRSLAGACGGGLLLALLSTAIHVDLPFIIVLLLVLLAVGGVVFGLRTLQKAGR